MERIECKSEIISLNLPKWLNETTSNFVSFLAAFQVGYLPYTSQKLKTQSPLYPVINIYIYNSQVKTNHSDDSLTSCKFLSHATAGNACFGVNLDICFIWLAWQFTAQNFCWNVITAQWLPHLAVYDSFPLQ